MRFTTLRTPRQWRRARRVLVCLAVAGLLAALVGRLALGSALFGAGMLGLVLMESAHLRRLVREADRQHNALLQIRPLLGELPLDLGGWAADPLFLLQAVQVLIDSSPSLVVECGSGSSTIVAARCLRALGHGRLISLEHDPEYARRTSDLLRLHGLGDVARVVTAPLAESELDGRRAQWYGTQYEPLLQGPIDVLIVDGPPGNTAPRARYPAVPLLLPQLAPECRILMDDGDRPDERAIARAWRDELGATLTYLPGGRGAWLLHRRPVAEP
ncbi:MAG TPA: class I SAM-dependent methyltransferase [Gemmatimonadales bacterium]